MSHTHLPARPPTLRQRRPRPQRPSRLGRLARAYRQPSDPTDGQAWRRWSVCCLWSAYLITDTLAFALLQLLAPHLPLLPLWLRILAAVGAAAITAMAVAQWCGKQQLVAIHAQDDAARRAILERRTLGELEAAAGIPVALDATTPCPQCAKPTVLGAHNCAYCGAALAVVVETPKARLCPRCGTRAPDDASFCPDCGAHLLLHTSAAARAEQPGALEVASAAAPSPLPTPVAPSGWPPKDAARRRRHVISAPATLPPPAWQDIALTLPPRPAHHPLTCGPRDPRHESRTGTDARLSPPRQARAQPLMTEADCAQLWRTRYQRAERHAPECPHCTDDNYHALSTGPSDYLIEYAFANLEKLHGRPGAGHAYAICRRCEHVSAIEFLGFDALTATDRLTWAAIYLPNGRTTRVSATGRDLSEGPADTADAASEV